MLRLMAIHPLAKSLLDEIDAFLKRADVNMTATTFGRMAVNDGKFVARITNGGGLTLATIDKVQRFIAGYQVAA